MGYPKETMGYYFYNPPEQKVFVSRNAVFLEKEFLLKEDSGSKIELGEVHDPQIEIDQPMDPKSITHIDEIIGEPYVTQAPRRSTRVRTLLDESVTVVQNDEPTSYDEVLKSSDSELWLKAMKSEINSMYDNQV